MKKLFGTLVILVAFLAVSSTAYGGSLVFRADLSAEQEVRETSTGSGVFVPADIVTDATGEVEAKFDDAFTRVDVVLRVQNAENVVAAHFHCGLPGKNGPVALGFFNPGPLVFDGEKAEGTLTNENFQQADCVPHIGRPVNNIAALAFAMREGLIYTNVHTNDGTDPPDTGPGDFPGGEIRGQMLEE
jgi:hypothetical protein